MPSDALTVAVTTGLGVSVLAGILSGICYILTHGLPHTRIRKPITPWHCNVCGGQFRSIQGILEVEKVVTCAKCTTKVCRVKCSRRDPERGWICQICQQPENWLKGLFTSIHPNKDRSNRMDADAVDGLDEDLMELRKKEREQVRDFIERLVESMLGGNLDDVTVSRIYNDKKYDSMFTRYHSDLSNALTDLGSALHISISNLPITGQSPSSAHAYLKELIQRFVNEAADLPSLRKHEDHPAHPEESLSDRTYEDLLSTAIINKVVQVNQNEGRSSTNSSRGPTTRKSGNKEYFFGEETLGNKWKSRDSIRDDASSVSSLEEWVRSDSSVGSSKYVDRVLLTIKQHIEEGSSSDEEMVDNASHIEESSLLQSGDENWHENWYFQKRRLTSSSSPVPVPMLVPNPITEAKVLIGDKEAEQFSDRDSDYGDTELVQDIKNILVNSKTIIGGKNPILAVDETDNVSHAYEDTVDGNNDNLKLQAIEDSQNVTEATSSNKHANTILANTEDIEQRTSYQDTINEYTVDPIDVDKYNQNVLHVPESNNEDDSLISIESNTEQDTEYTEQYASLTRTFLKHSTPVPRKDQAIDCYVEDAIRQLENGVENNIQRNGNSRLIENDSDEEQMRIFKGSYSEREKEKWKHSSVDIPDNPYSPENLERRLSSRSSNGSSSSIYARDYYIKNAAKSAGARSPSKLLTESEPTEDLSTVNNSDDAVNIVSAVPAVVNQEESIEYESITESPHTNPTRLIAAPDISSDSDLSIERVYNLQSGKVFETKGNVRQEIHTIDSYSPEGLKYMPKKFDESIAEYIDESSSNTAIQSNKEAFMRSLTQNDDETSEIVIDDNLNVIPIEELVDVVPYDENTFKTTLEKFKLVTHVIDGNIESHKFEGLKNANTSSAFEGNKEMMDVVEIVSETNYEQDICLNTNDRMIPEIATSLGEVKHVADKTNTSDYSEEEILSDTREFSLEYSTDINGDDISRTESSLETDSEIIDLKEKRLVRDMLGKFSRSYSNISIVQSKKVEEPINVSSEMESDTIKDTSEIDVIPSVKNLKQLFDRNNSSNQVKKDITQIYSLTARSLPREVRQQLRSDETSMDHEENITEQRVVDEETEELLPIDIAKNRIAFYEHLGSNK